MKQGQVQGHCFRGGHLGKGVGMSLGERVVGLWLSGLSLVAPLLARLAQGFLLVGKLAR